MSVKLPWDDPTGEAASEWAIARTVLAAAIYLMGSESRDPVADSYAKADLFLDQLAKDVLENQKRKEPKP
jgi:hypothetical protein